MAKFTKFEEELIESIEEPRLRTSLAMIRQAAEDIWASDTPHIIRDFTDHGIEHSERLVQYAVQLMKANAGNPFLTQQLYLLLAGIYVHDIGMQCDVVQFPKIKERAEALGAVFDHEFTAQTASNYSVDEQKAIRRNHQYLTIAWIDYAYRTGETVLGPAVKTVPGELIAELMDVCLYHARLPIANCPPMLKSYPNQRKQLVAALLRFADELDVDCHRVNIETVKNFRLDPSNSIYWWLHNRTNITFSAPNVVRLTIRLHPEDARRRGATVHTAFITEFQRKNRPVLDVLRQDGFPIAIDGDSEVVEDDYTEPLPSEIVQALNAMQQDPHLHILKVPAAEEGGINSGIYLEPNVRVSIVAAGVISYDSLPHFTNPDGLFSTHRGQPLLHPGIMGFIAWPNPDAYRTDGGRPGIIGSLFGWIGEYSEDSAFFVGESREIVAETEGYLHLSVNDAKGTYEDNKGEFEVRIRVLSSGDSGGEPLSDQWRSRTAIVPE
jgi:hypothetical protein